jgi:dCMP deaminase
MWEGGKEFKPDWDTFYMAQAFLVAQRSVDKNTAHGACLVSQDNRLLSIGYNGPLRGAEPLSSDLENRPSKYWLMIHSEENCILNYHGSYSDLKGSTLFVTGHPCHRCINTVAQKGVRNVVYGSVGSHCVDEEDSLATETILRSLRMGGQEFYIQDFIRMDEVKDLLKRTLSYIDYKENDNG